MTIDKWFYDCIFIFCGLEFLWCFLHTLVVNKFSRLKKKKLIVIRLKSLLGIYFKVVIKPCKRIFI